MGFTTVSAGCLPVVSGVNQTSIWESNPTNDSRHWCLPNFDKGIEPNQRLRGLRVGVSVLAPVVPCVGGLHASGESHGLSGVRASGGSHGLRAGRCEHVGTFCLVLAGCMPVGKATVMSGLHASGGSHGLSGVRASGGSHGLRADLFLMLRVGNKNQTLGVGVSMLAPGCMPVGEATVSQRGACLWGKPRSHSGVPCVGGVPSVGVVLRDNR